MPVGPGLEWARSGAMALTGESEGPPGFAGGGLATAARGAGQALAALAPGAGFEALDAPALLGERAALFGFGRRGRGSCGGSARLVAARDGALAVNLPRDDDWRLLEAWLEAPLGDIEARRDWAAVEQAIAKREAAGLVERGREIGLAVALAVPACDAPPRPFRLEHATRSAAPERGASSRNLRRPRVLDLSTLWAGPLAGALLAQAGFDVLKLESASRPDGAREGVPAFFDLLHAGKRGGTLDLAARRDREVFIRLLDAADVVLESARPRALAQLGFDASAWVGARPGRLWASITGYGRDHEWIAFGDDAAVAAGLAFDPEGDRLRFCADAVADPLTGLYAAVAIAGLQSEGRGGLLSLALAEVAAHAAGAGGGAELVLPRRLREGAWTVLDGDGAETVAPPRARPAVAAAPALRPIEPALVEAWTRPC
ncbi:MAG: CoA transferase [Deltaproteobacteria bacterium]|nr:CoA transferase [Deltaproteobacteria bacterium]